MERLLKTQPWIIFILLTVGLFMSNFTVENDTLTTLILKILGFTILFIYPFTVGLVLNDHLPERIKLNFNFYLFNCFIWVMGYFVLLIVAEGQVSGLAAIPMFYVFYAFLHFLAFPAKTLKSIELNKEASLGDYLGDFFLIVFLPIGIWFLHPRVRRIIEKEEIINEMDGRPNR